MTWTVASYLSYLLVTVPLTVWVASTLSRNGRVFLRDVFAGKEQLAEAVNTLLVVGFYLLNIGFVLLYLRSGQHVFSLRGLVETVSTKVGWVMLVLGVVHFCNVYVFNAIRRRSRIEHLRAATMPPQAFLPQGPGMPPPRPPYPGQA